MKTIHYLAAIALAAAAMLGLGSCNSSDSPQYVSSMMAFVTFEGSTENGSTFTTREKDDSPLVTYTSSLVLKEEDYPKGTRYILGFTNAEEKPWISGPINIIAIMNVTNGKIEKATEQVLKDLTREECNVVMIQRAGVYVNVQASAAMTYAPRDFGLYADPASLENAIPDVYLGFRSDNTGAMMREIFGSFSIASIWNDAKYTGLRLHFTTVDGTQELLLEKPLPLTPGTTPVE